MFGNIVVITGGMFSGKSEELIKRCKKFAEYGKKRVKVYKPLEDTRFSEEEVVSRIGYRFPATNVPKEITEEIANQIIEEAKFYDVIGFDETQFFSKRIIDVLEELAYQRKYVIVAGLNMNFRGREFGYLGGALAMADEVVRVFSFCNVCGSEKGTHTQRLVNGKPAKKTSPTILLGDTESYEPRCRQCFIPPNKI